jgi:transcriptional regulator with XRE-family HTH domain
VGDDLDDAPIANLVTVAERAVDHVAAPVFGQPVDVGKRVHQTGGGEHSASYHAVAPGELNTELVVIGAGHVDRAAGEDLAAMTTDLVATYGEQLRRRSSLVAEVAVHVGGRGIARLAGVDDDHRAALTTELERGRQAGGRPPDDGDVAMPLDDSLCVVTHGFDDTVDHIRCKMACNIRKIGAKGHDAMAEPNEIERVVRTRLRSLRNTLGLSLDELAARANLSASTISRVETGKRTISLDILLPLASALHVDLDALLDVQSDDDVVIRPVPSGSSERTTWMLSRPTGNTIAIKMRLEPTDRTPEQRVHPGHDWFFVIEGRVRLLLGEREIIVETGEAAEFATMTPHAFVASDGPAELVMIFDRDGERAHVHRESVG